MRQMLVFVILAAATLSATTYLSVGTFQSATQLWMQLPPERQMVVNGLLAEGIGRDSAVLFSDFDCRFSKAFELAFEIPQGFQRRFGSFLTNESEEKARVAVCVEGNWNERGVLAMLYSGPLNLALIVDELGIGARVDLLDCLRSDSTDARLRLDAELAQTLGISGTPAVYGEKGLQVGLPAEVIDLLNTSGFLDA